MTIEQAIKKAIEGGWSENDVLVQALKKNVDEKVFRGGVLMNIHQALLDPSFWQCLGKAMGWLEVQDDTDPLPMDGWRNEWHNLIDHLADGGTIESYFEKL